MHFWASAEIYQPASAAMVKTRSYVTSFLNTTFEKSKLSTFNCELRYIPIIMPEGMRERYPARSQLKKKENVYVCAPQLNYEIFVEGTFEAQLREYLNGIAPSAPHLAGLGATKEQIAEFEFIIATAADRILAAGTGETKH